MRHSPKAMLMPRSKHRHKTSGKSVKHPGRDVVPPFRFSAQERAWSRFDALYTAPFHAEWKDPQPHDAGYLLDLIADEAFDHSTGTLQPVSKAAVFVEFVRPIDDGEPDEFRSAEMTEAALAFLVEQGMVLVDGDQLTVPARFSPGTDSDHKG
jgi:hypothetical protein